MVAAGRAAVRRPLWSQAATRARHKADAACARSVSGACARRLYALCVCHPLSTSETGSEVVLYVDQLPQTTLKVHTREARVEAAPEG